MFSRLRGFFSKPVNLWLACWLLTLLLYLPAWKGGFQQDFEGWLAAYYNEPFWDVINRKSAGIVSFYQLTQLQLYGWTTIFGTHPLPWFLLFSGLHALNGVLLFRLCSALASDFGLRHPRMVAAVGALLVLFNPSMTEVVVWKASYHYLVGVQAILWMLTWARQYLKTGANRWIGYSVALSIPLTFTLEIWYTIPVLVAMLTIAYRRAGLTDKKLSNKALVRLVLPLFLVFMLHLFAYRLLYGRWLAHGAYETGNEHGPWFTIARFWAYEWHLLGFGRFFPHEVRSSFYRQTGSVGAGIAALCLLLAFAGWAWLRFARWSAGARLATLLWAWSLVSLAIVLHFTPPDLFVVSNDRYLYLTAFFQWSMIAVLLGMLLRKVWSFRIVAGLVLILCMGFTLKLVMQWRSATKVFWAVQNKFVWHDAPTVLILNMPSLYNGVGIIRGSDTSELAEHLQIFSKKACKGVIYDVSSYNMQQPGDGAHVTVLDSNHLQVTLNQWGSWWHMRGLGAVDRSNDLFDLHLDDPGHMYTLTLKQHVPGMVILYHQGWEWRVVDMSKRGQEQW